MSDGYVRLKLLVLVKDLFKILAKRRLSELVLNVIDL